MKEALVLLTDCEGLTLHELATEGDDAAYFEAQNENPDHIRRFNTFYETIEDVRDVRLHSGKRIRMGIWGNDTFVGKVDAKPGDEDTQVEIGYWLKPSAMGNGYASLAVKALTAYVSPLFPRVFAEVRVDNQKSAQVLERSGYEYIHEAERDWGRAIIFEPSSKPHLVDYEPKYQEGFASLVNDGHAEFGFPPNYALDKDLDQPEAFYRNIWVMTENDKVVGSVALKDDGSDEAILKRMYLRPQLRGRGYGRLLLKTAITEAHEAGYLKLTLDTNARQKSAQRAYEVAGFKLTAKHGNVLVYELNLD